jgi:glycerol-3-phosphate acyltransferase PlsX
VIAGTERPSQAIRRAKTTSMGRAIAAVKSGQARRRFSAGNTGAMMAMSKLALRTMPGIDRPALAASAADAWRERSGHARSRRHTRRRTRRISCSSRHGAAYSRVVLDLERPRVQLLNIGTEALKGTDALRKRRPSCAMRIISVMRFDGFVEGDKISRGDVDVVVSDGFSGNIALKTAEGTARFVTDLLRRAFTTQSGPRSAS